nr:hypothetical protein [Tanacetum cinerariifolium]
MKLSKQLFNYRQTDSEMKLKLKMKTSLINLMTTSRKSSKSKSKPKLRFINKLDDNIKKIIKEQVKAQVKEQVTKILPKIKKTENEQLEAEVLTRSSNEAKTSHAVAANISELELKKILVDKMENTVTIKRRRDGQDEYEEPSAGSNWGSKRRRAGKEPKLTSVPKEKTSGSSGKSKEGSKSHHTSTSKFVQSDDPIHTDDDLEEPAHQEFDTGFTKDQPAEEVSQRPDWFQKSTKPLNPDRDWNKTLSGAQGHIQPWISDLTQDDSRDSFNELMYTPLDFSAFVMNRLKVDTLTLELLVGLTFKLMKGSCKSLVDLEYFLEEVYKATTNQLDWNNPEGQQYPHDLRKPLPLIPDSQGCRVIPFDHFINNDLEYLRGVSLSRSYATLVTKTKAAGYGHIKWIEDLVPNTMWSPVSVIYDKHAQWDILSLGSKASTIL